jgi:hypothetical protein
VNVQLREMMHTWQAAAAVDPKIRYTCGSERQLHHSPNPTDTMLVQ